MNRFLVFWFVLLLCTACRDKEPPCDPIIDLGAIEPSEETFDLLPPAYLIGADLRFENKDGDQIKFTSPGPRLAMTFPGREPVTCEDGDAESVYTFERNMRATTYTSFDEESPLVSFRVVSEVVLLDREMGEPPTFVDAIIIEAIFQFAGTNGLIIEFETNYLQGSDRATGEDFGSLRSPVFESLRTKEIFGELFEDLLTNEEETVFFKVGEGVVAFADQNGNLWKRVQ